MTRLPTPVSAAVRRVACPRCGAGKGERCVTTRGRAGNAGTPVSNEHEGRYLAAVAAGYLPLRGDRA
jgi:hypothetical protein